MTLARVGLAGNHGSSIAVMDHSTLELTDARIEDSLPVEPTGQLGRAIELQYGVSAIVRRTVIERSHEAAVVVQGSFTLGAADASFEDIEIRDVRARVCAADGRCADPAGIALSAGFATVRLNRFVIDQAELCGVQISQGAMLDLSQGRVTRASVGACVQVDGYDLMRLTDRVVYEDNGINISSTSFYVPMTSFGAP